MRAAAFVIVLAAAAAHAADAVRLHKTLYEAAASKNIQQFDKTLTRARDVVESMPLGDARNRLRRAVVIATDLERVLRFDAVYWDEETLPDYYDRLAGEYSDFGKFIAAYRLIDRSGRVFYPAQETQQFLLRQLRPPNPRKRST